MILAIDIGNTNTGFGIFSGDKLVKSMHLPTEELEYSRIKIDNFIDNKDIISTGISSVVTGKIRFLDKLINNKFAVYPVLIKGSTRLPIRIKVLNRITLGSDRICNAVSGYYFYKKKYNVIIIDCGTAITYDVVQKNGNYEGGAIAPGLYTLAQSLNNYTFKLPLLTKSDFKITDNPVGKHTLEALNSGIVNAFIDSVNGMILRICKYYKSDFKIIITGGDALFIMPKLKYKAVYLENCVLEGINIIINELNEF